jgi:hypothetical protein
VFSIPLDDARFVPAASLQSAAGKPSLAFDDVGSCLRGQAIRGTTKAEARRGRLTGGCSPLFGGIIGPKTRCCPPMGTRGREKAPGQARIAEGR